MLRGDSPVPDTKGETEWVTPIKRDQFNLSTTSKRPLTKTTMTLSPFFKIRGRHRKRWNAIIIQITSHTFSLPREAFTVLRSFIHTKSDRKERKRNRESELDREDKTLQTFSAPHTWPVTAWIGTTETVLFNRSLLSDVGRGVGDGVSTTGSTIR